MSFKIKNAPEQFPISISIKKKIKFMPQRENFKITRRGANNQFSNLLRHFFSKFSKQNNRFWKNFYQIGRHCITAILNFDAILNRTKITFTTSREQARLFVTLRTRLHFTIQNMNMKIRILLTMKFKFMQIFKKN